MPTTPMPPGSTPATGAEPAAESSDRLQPPVHTEHSVSRHTATITIVNRAASGKAQALPCPRHWCGGFVQISGSQEPQAGRGLAKRSTPRVLFIVGCRLVRDIGQASCQSLLLCSTGDRCPCAIEVRRTDSSTPSDQLQSRDEKAMLLKRPRFVSRRLDAAALARRAGSTTAQSKPSRTRPRPCSKVP